MLVPTTYRIYKTTRDEFRDFIVALPPKSVNKLRVDDPVANIEKATLSDRVHAQMRVMLVDSARSCKHDYLAPSQHNLLAADHYYILTEDLDEDASIKRMAGYATVMDLNGAMIDYVCAPTRDLKHQLIRVIERDARERGMPFVALITAKRRAREYAGLGYSAMRSNSMQSQLKDVVSDVSSSLRRLQFLNILGSLMSLLNAKRVADRTTMVKVL